MSARWWKLTLGKARADPAYYLGTTAMVPGRASYAVRARLALRRHRVLDEAELRATRRSETVFIFGSGYSINDLTPAEIAHFERHDTLGFNWFLHQRIVRMDYHLVREIAEDDRDETIWRAQVYRYFELTHANPLYRRTVFLLQSGLWALNANRALALGAIPKRNPIFLWRSRPGRRTLSRSFSEGLSHPDATLEECINFAFLAGWREIVLVGVDLYDRRYFWLQSNETRANDQARGASNAQPHDRAESGLVETIGAWARELTAEGVLLSVYNPRSLLREVLPLHARP